MKLDDVIDLMVKFGLDEKEARAITHLTNMGESKVADLATAAGLKRAETYQILERLQGRGLVDGTLARPRTFVAAHPERAIQILVDERARELKSVESLREEAQRHLSSLAGSTTEAPTSSYRILQDTNQIMGQLSRTVRDAKREVCVAASNRSFNRLLDEGLEEDLRAAHEAGVKVRVLTELLAGQDEDIERLLTYAEVRHLMVPRPLRFLLADESEIVQYVTADALVTAAKETALWIGATDHVQAQRAFFDDLWWSGIDARHRLKELETGRPAPQAQLVRGRFTRIEKEKEMLIRAKREVVAQLSPAEVGFLEKAGLRRALESCAAHGVKVQLLVPPGTTARVKGAEMRETAHVAQELPTLVVDGHEAILVLPAAPGDGAITATEEYALCVTVAPSVQALDARLRAAWAAAKE